MEKIKYNTRQREILLAYLQTESGRHITAKDVCEHFRKNGSGIGQSTVYRQLESLVDEGVLNKYVVDANSPACFEYVPQENHCGEVCYHCKCEECGKLIHLHCAALREVQEHLLSEHAFRVDTRRTVFYGLCETCSKKKASRN